MLFRSLMALVAAVVIASPVFAEDAATTDTTGATDTSLQSGDTAAQADKINLNTATAKELMKVKGINASKARAIVIHRKKNGDFKSVDDVANVKGFKKLNADQLKAITDQLTIS